MTPYFRGDIRTKIRAFSYRMMGWYWHTGDADVVPPPGLVLHASFGPVRRGLLSSRQPDGAFMQIKAALTNAHNIRTLQIFK